MSCCPRRPLSGPASRTFSAFQESLLEQRLPLFLHIKSVVWTAALGPPRPCQSAGGTSPAGRQASPTAHGRPGDRTGQGGGGDRTRGRMLARPRRSVGCLPGQEHKPRARLGPSEGDLEEGLTGHQQVRRGRAEAMPVPTGFCPGTPPPGAE